MPENNKIFMRNKLAEKKATELDKHRKDAREAVLKTSEPDASNISRYKDAKDANNANSGLEYSTYNAMSYNGPNNQDLINRGLAVLEGAKYYIEHANEIGNKKELYDVLKNKMEQLEKYIHDNANINNVVGNSSEDSLSEYQKDKINAYIKTADTHISNMLKEIAQGLHNVLPNKSRRQILKELQWAETLNTSEKGRPTLVSDYMAVDMNMLSMQQPMGHQTKKQLVRNGLSDTEATEKQDSDEAKYTATSKLRNASKTANFTLQTVAHVEGENVAVDNTFLRGAVVAMGIKDPIERAAVTTGNMEEVVEVLVNEYLKAGVDPEELGKNGIAISSMSLLSALGLLNVLDGDNQRQLIKDLHIALRSINGKTITVRDHDKKNDVDVKVNVNEMAMGVNNFRAEGLIHDSHKKINVRGFNELHDSVAAFIGDSKYFEDLKKDETTINRSLLNNIYTNRLELDRLSSQLKEISEDYLEAKKLDNRGNIKICENKFNKLNKIIDKQEEQLYKLESKLQDYREQYWLKNKDNLIEHISELGNTESDRAIFLFKDMQELYYNKHFYADDPKDNYQFQMRYVELANTMGNMAFFHCKSCEDRTGELANKIEAAKICEIKNKAILPYKSDQESEDFKKAKRAVHQFSTSTANTDKNASGARGLQINHKAKGFMRLFTKGDGCGEYTTTQLLMAKREKSPYKKLAKWAQAMDIKEGIAESLSAAVKFIQDLAGKKNFTGGLALIGIGIAVSFALPPLGIVIAAAGCIISAKGIYDEVKTMLAERKDIDKKPILRDFPNIEGTEDKLEKMMSAKPVEEVAQTNINGNNKESKSVWKRAANNFSSYFNKVSEPTLPQVDKQNSTDVSP